MVAEVYLLSKFLWAKPNEHSYNGPPANEKIPTPWVRSMEVYLHATSIRYGDNLRIRGEHRLGRYQSRGI